MLPLTLENLKKVDTVIYYKNGGSLKLLARRTDAADVRLNVFTSDTESIDDKACSFTPSAAVYVVRLLQAITGFIFERVPASEVKSIISWIRTEKKLPKLRKTSERKKATRPA